MMMVAMVVVSLVMVVMVVVVEVDTVSPRLVKRKCTRLLTYLEMVLD